MNKPTTENPRVIAYCNWQAPRQRRIHIARGALVHVARALRSPYASSGYDPRDSISSPRIALEILAHEAHI